jgi:hypothetical protein
LIAERFQRYANELRENAFAEWQKDSKFLHGQSAMCSGGEKIWKGWYATTGPYNCCGCGSWNSPIQGGVQNF